MCVPLGENHRLGWNYNVLILGTFSSCLIITATRNQSLHTFYGPQVNLSGFFALCARHWQKADGQSRGKKISKKNRSRQGNLTIKIVLLIQ